MLLVRRFAFFALEDQHASCMTCRTGPSCHRMDTLVNLPLESSCLLSSPAGWCYRSCVSSVGGARPCGSGALPPVLGFKDVR
jgi:hypothetical protein